VANKFDTHLSWYETFISDGMPQDEAEDLVLSRVASSGEGSFRSIEELRRAGIEGVEETDTGWKGLGRAAIQGATFGLGDELRGVGAALVPGGEGYKEAQQRSLGRVEEVRRQRPVASTVAELAGSLPTSLALTRGASMIAPIGRGLRSTRALPRMNLLSKGGPAPTLGRAGTMGLLGAAEGAVYGAGSAESGDRLRGAGVGAAIGAPLGGAAGLLPGAAHAVRRTAQGTRPGLHAAEAVEEAMGLPVNRAIPAGSAVTPVGPARVRGLLKTGDESVAPLKGRQDAQRRVLEDVNEEANAQYAKLDEDFARGWDIGSLRPKSDAAVVSKQNADLAGKLRELMKTPKIRRAFLSRQSGGKGISLPSMKEVNPEKLTSLRSALMTRTNANGKQVRITVGKATSKAKKVLADRRAAEKVENLPFAEVHAFQKNLKILALKGETGAQGALDEVDKLMKSLYGSRLSTATGAKRSAVRKLDIYNIGSNFDTKFAGRSLPNPKAFSKTKLRTSEGLRTAVRKLREHPSVINVADDAEKMVLEKHLKAGVAADWLETLMKSDRKTAAKALADVDGEWLRQLFDEGIRGERKYQQALREIKSATPFSQKFPKLSKIMGAAALLGTARWMFGGGGPAGLLDVAGP
jgi:hypothetical protein